VSRSPDRDENVLLAPLRLHGLLQKAASPVMEWLGIQRDYSADAQFVRFCDAPRKRIV
jgi:hypothetical protein